MNTKPHNLLHFVLIILLMLAPLRSVFAMQLIGCDMNASSAEAISSSKQIVSSSAHCQHMMGSVASNDNVSNQFKPVANSCCSDDGPCGSSCHFSITASLFMQSADYSPTLLNSDLLDNISSALLVRELNPPSRPPLPLYS